VGGSARITLGNYPAPRRTLPTTPDPGAANASGGLNTRKTFAQYASSYIRE